MKLDIRVRPGLADRVRRWNAVRRVLGLHPLSTCLDSGMRSEQPGRSRGYRDMCFDLYYDIDVAEMESVLGTTP